MKKIIPFKKEIIFKTNISEITSISLEHQLVINNLDISGEFLITGDYKVSDNSKTVEAFDFNIPFEIMLDEKYDTKNAEVDIDDFYYEIIDDKVLSVSIDVRVDKLLEKLITPEIPDVTESKDYIEELYEEQNREEDGKIVIEDVPEIKEDKYIERCIEEDDILPGEEEMKHMEETMNKEDKEIKKNNKVDNNIKDSNSVNDKINSLFSNISNDDMYVTYNVYIIRDGDTIESIMKKYEVSEEQLKEYNDLSDLKLGDKIIIPVSQ